MAPVGNKGKGGRRFAGRRAAVFSLSLFHVFTLILSLLFLFPLFRSPSPSLLVALAFADVQFEMHGITTGEVSSDDGGSNYAPRAHTGVRKGFGGFVG